MSEQFEELKRDYRNIRAPLSLAPRVRAAVADHLAQHHFWMPAAAAVAAVVAVGVLLWMRPLDIPEQVAGNQPPVRPSMSTLASLSLTRPAMATPGMSQLRSVSVPRLPDKPRPAGPPAKSHNDTDLMKEKDYALT